MPKRDHVKQFASTVLNGLFYFRSVEDAKMHLAGVYIFEHP